MFTFAFTSRAIFSLNLVLRCHQLYIPCLRKSYWYTSDMVRRHLQQTQLPFVSLGVIGNDAVEDEIVLLVLLKVVPVTVLRCRQEFDMWSIWSRLYFLTFSLASHPACGSSSRVYLWSGSPLFPLPRTLTCTHVAGEGILVAVFGWNWSSVWLFKTVIYESPVLLPHGQSREFFQCTQPGGNQLKAWSQISSGLKTNPSAAILTLHSFILPSSQPIISFAFLDSSTTLKKNIKVSEAKYSNTRPLYLAWVVLLNVPEGSLKLVEIFLHLCDAFCMISIFLQEI